MFLEHIVQIISKYYIAVWIGFSLIYCAYCIFYIIFSYFIRILILNKDARVWCLGIYNIAIKKPS